MSEFQQFVGPMLEAGNGHALHDVGRIGEPDITAITEIKMLLIDTLGRKQLDAEYSPERARPQQALNLRGDLASCSPIPRSPSTRT